MPQKINYSNTTPAAPAGTKAVLWQADAPSADPTVIRNISAYVPLTVFEATDAIVTAALAVGASESGSAPIAKTFVVLAVQASAPCRVELYTTAALAALDLTRAANTPPTAGAQHGVILDLVLAATTTWVLSPAATGGNQEAVRTNNISYRITNTGSATAAITVTLTLLILEA